MKVIIFSLVFTFAFAMKVELHSFRMADSNATAVTTNSTTSENSTITNNTGSGNSTIPATASPINNTEVKEEEKDILDEIKEILEDDMLPSQRVMKKKLTGIKENQEEIKTLQSETKVSVKTSKGSLKTLQDTVDSIQTFLNTFAANVKTRFDKIDGGKSCGRSDTIRLRDKFGNINTRAGRLEVFVNGKWGTVDDDMANSSTDTNHNVAKVVCFELGYGRIGTAYTSQQFANIAGSEPGLISGITCNGNEASVTACTIEIAPYSGHGTDLGIGCA